jgi:micrococcal nuclease
MIGLDTPETVDPRKPLQCFGLEASVQAKTMLGGQSVYLETDPSQTTASRNRGASSCSRRLTTLSSRGHS